jgi:mannitol-1-/sugar-/sorbitol-6-phosphatase
MTIQNIAPATSLPSRSYDAFLFDMDGTILNSIASVERVWTRWSKRHNADLDRVFSVIHGRQSADAFRELDMPGVDPIAEAKWILQHELDDLADVHAVPGAIEFLASLPAGKWAVVTSAPLVLAKARLKAAGFPLPDDLITAADIVHGKPAPDAFLKGAERLRVDPGDCLVFEDAAAGIASAEAAGADVVVITATHRHPLATDHLKIADYTAVHSQADDKGQLSLVAR